MQIMLYNVTLNNKAGGISVCKTRTMLDEPVSPLLSLLLSLSAYIFLCLPACVCVCVCVCVCTCVMILLINCWLSPGRSLFCSEVRRLAVGWCFFPIILWGCHMLCC